MPKKAHGKIGGVKGSRHPHHRVAMVASQLWSIAGRKPRRGDPLNPMHRHPALILAALGVVSGILGTVVPGPGIGVAPQVGLHMMLAGAWFGLVVGFGVWRWGNRLWGAVATAFAATCAGWELAVNAAMQLNEHWLEAVALPEALRLYVSGLCAGAIGAFVTWAGVAMLTKRLRQPVVSMGVVATGALLGLLLPFTNNYDNAAILLLPWQTAIAAILGACLAPEPKQRRPGLSVLASR